MTNIRVNPENKKARQQTLSGFNSIHGFKNQILKTTGVSKKDVEHRLKEINVIDKMSI